MLIISIIRSCGAYFFTNRLTCVHMYVPSSLRTRISLLSWVVSPFRASSRKRINKARSSGWKCRYVPKMSDNGVSYASPCWIIQQIKSSYTSFKFYINLIVGRFYIGNCYILLTICFDIRHNKWRIQFTTLRNSLTI